jgi:hypothetical protein
MNAKERIEWLNARDPLHQWKVGQDVYCLHCEAVFKAEDIGEDAEGLLGCPLCGATPLDLHSEPWWREDLTEEKLEHVWRVEPIRATPGQPRKLPPSAEDRIGLN